MGTLKVVVTGAPGTGKTSIINGLENKGHHCFHEIIRDMTSKAKKTGNPDDFVSNPLVFVDDAHQFNRDLLHGRAGHFKDSLVKGTPLTFFDRGIPDVLAYMDFFGQEYGNEFLKVAQENRYDAIFIAPPWQEIYTTDNERLESYEEAEKLHIALVNSYSSLGYDPIEIPKMSVAERVAFVLEQLKSD